MLIGLREIGRRLLSDGDGRGFAAKVVELMELKNINSTDENDDDACVSWYDGLDSSTASSTPTSHFEPAPLDSDSDSSGDEGWGFGGGVGDENFGPSPNSSPTKNLGEETSLSPPPRSSLLPTGLAPYLSP